MIQATGLTSTPRRNQPPVVDDLTFEAPAGRVTALLGGPGAGKTTALRLLLQLDRGHGSAFFRGRPLHRIRRPAHEIGVLLEDVPGHPGRTVRGHLRMLGAAAGVPAARADVVLDVVGLTDLADERLGDLSTGAERRLGIAIALLGDPHTLVLDEPARGLSARETAWLYGLLRQFAAQGGAVLVATEDAEDAIRVADQVLTLESGRLVADQPVGEFAQTRLRPRVVVHSPLVGRLAAVLEEEVNAARQLAEAKAEEEARAAAELAAKAEAAKVDAAPSDVAEGVDAAKGESAAPKVRKRALWRKVRKAQSAARGAAVGAEAKRATVEAAAKDKVARSDDKVARSDDKVGKSDDKAARPNDKVAKSDKAKKAAPAASVPAPAAEADAAAARTGAVAGTEAEDEPVTALADPFSVVRDDDTHISVYGLSPASVGETAYRHGIVVHRLVEETADLGPGASAGARARDPEAPPLRLLPKLRFPGPAWPMRYELRRTTGVRTGWLIGVAAIVASLLASVLLARAGGVGELHRLTGWPADLPLPPVAIAAGLLGALAFGDEFRFPALAATRDAVPRRLGLLAAKFAVCAAGAVLLSLGVIVLDSAALLLLVGGSAVPLPGDWPELVVAVFGLTIGSSWAGLLAAGVFRSTALGLATLLAVPILAVPVVQRAAEDPSLRTLAMLPHRLRAATLDRPPSMIDRGLAVALRLASQPVGQALMLSVAVLLCAYALTGLRGRSTRQ
ncbi:ATP-binding cassette domain-containing protein [Streptomyces melanosporofaciens]|uniref:ABC-type multidrug transport system, ATPase component n=1 Tax=Streptomyces melanosporofaciens TaxID=67327 RepID=A0A1H4UTL0_STRMJ|nr:ATP-binding cassette domain-containing protein [Streptomyces melanosporofaciens]SEC71880.1 ABC-type multidrug transport system, ATPase component [Streptomyces melanosporofaciens]